MFTWIEGGNGKEELKQRTYSYFEIPTGMRNTADKKKMRSTAEKEEVVLTNIPR